jgi:hypothetical protein
VLIGMVNAFGTLGAVYAQRSACHPEHRAADGRGRA